MKRTASQIIQQAFNMLGYEKQTSITSQAISAVNIIAMDIFYMREKEGYTPVTSLGSVLDFEEEIINDTIPHGVASLIAEMLDDAEKQALYTAYYNKKRAKINGKTEIFDGLPVGEL